MYRELLNMNILVKIITSSESHDHNDSYNNWCFYTLITLYNEHNIMNIDG